MWTLLGSLISNFLLLRDLFGYAIPGAVMLAIVDHYKHPVLSNVPLINDSIWIKLVVAVTASYVVGHVLAAIGYTFYEIVNWIFKCSKNRAEGCSGSGGAALDERKATGLYYRYLYPNMSIEADRRETLTILRVALSVALIAAAFLPVEMMMSRRVEFLVLGLFLLWNGYKSLGVAEYFGNLASMAGKRAEDNHIPVFHWSSGSSSDDAKESAKDSEKGQSAQAGADAGDARTTTSNASGTITTS